MKIKSIAITTLAFNPLQLDLTTITTPHRIVPMSPMLSPVIFCPIDTLFITERRHNKGQLCSTITIDLAEFYLLNC